MGPANISASLLTSCNVIKSLKKCGFEAHKHWEELASSLGVPAEIINQQRLRSHMVDWTYWGSLEECVHWWLRNSPCPTWAELTSAIGRVDVKSANEMKILNSNVKGITPKRKIYWMLLLWQIPLLVGGTILWIVRYSDNHIVDKHHKVETLGSNQQVPPVVVPTMPPLNQRIWVAGDTGSEVVEECIRSLIGALDDDGFDYEFLRRLAFVMSRNGNPLHVLHIDGGIWQVSRYALDRTKEIDETTSTLLKQCEQFLGIEKWRRISKIDLEKPIYSAVAARLYLSTITDEDIPPSDDIIAQQDYWWKYYMLNHEARRFTDDRDYQNAMRTYLSMKKGRNQ